MIPAPGLSLSRPTRRFGSQDQHEPNSSMTARGAIASLFPWLEHEPKVQSTKWTSLVLSILTSTDTWGTSECLRGDINSMPLKLSHSTSCCYCFTLRWPRFPLPHPLLPPLPRFSILQFKTAECLQCRV